MGIRSHIEIILGYPIGKKDWDDVFSEMSIKGITHKKMISLLVGILSYIETKENKDKNTV